MSQRKPLLSQELYLYHPITQKAVDNSIYLSYPWIMLGFSFGEILFLGLLALIVIGPKQLPEVARNVARFINDLKRSTQGFTDELKQSAKVDFDIKRDITEAAKAALEKKESPVNSDNTENKS